MEGTTSLGALHHHHGLGQAHLETVAAGEVAGTHRRAGRVLADEQPPGSHLGLEAVVVPGIDPL